MSPELRPEGTTNPVETVRVGEEKPTVEESTLDPFTDRRDPGNLEESEESKESPAETETQAGQSEESMILESLDLQPDRLVESDVPHSSRRHTPSTPTTLDPVSKQKGKVR